MNRIRWRILHWINDHFDVCWADLCDYREGFIREAFRRHRDLTSPLPQSMCDAPCWCGKADALKALETDQ